jgi:fructokinase
MSQAVDIVTQGELLVDMFPQTIGVPIGEVEAFIPKPGGAPANVAVAARRLGVTTAFIGKVGEDHFGWFLRDVLVGEGVNIQGLRFDKEARTTMAVIAMPDESSAQFVFYRNPGADQRLQPEELDEALISSARALHVGSLSLTHEPARAATFHALELAREAGNLLSCDVNYRPSLWSDPSEALRQAKRLVSAVDVVKVNEIEAKLLAGLKSLEPKDPAQLRAAGASLLGLGPALVVITLGEAGSYFFSEQGSGLVPGFTVGAVDAIGCGDAFMAGLLVSLVQHGDWKAKLIPSEMESVLRFANAAGALTSMKRGAMPAMPTRNQVETFLRERS